MMQTCGIDAPNGSESTLDDRDGDTIMDNVDNCPDIANRDQDNEDGDMFGNLCDPCPPLGPPGNADPDMDGVGDGCDPNPVMPGDSIALFDGFDRPPPASSGAITAGLVTFANGRAALASNGNDTHVLWPMDPNQNRTMRSKLAVESFGANPNGVGVGDRFVAMTGVACQVGVSAMNMTHWYLVEAPTTERATMDMNITMNQDMTISMRRTGNNYNCFNTLSAQQLLHTATLNSTAAPPVYTGIRAVGVGAHFDWFMVVNSP